MSVEQAEKKSLVQCRIEACGEVDRIAQAEEVSIKKAMEKLAGESGVPFGTLNRWYYMDDESKSNLKTEVTQVPKSTAKTKAKVINKIVDNIAKAQAKEEENAMSTAQGQAARELADGLGGAVLAEELYELFLKKIEEVSKVISANRELTAPMSTDAVVIQLLRLARNAGWTEPVVEEPEDIDTGMIPCNKCKVTSCPNRTCKNHKPKKKVKTTKPKKEKKNASGKA